MTKADAEMSEAEIPISEDRGHRECRTNMGQTIRRVHAGRWSYDIWTKSSKSIERSELPKQTARMRQTLSKHELNDVSPNLLILQLPG